MIQDRGIIDLLETGMRAEGMRQQAIAANLANMNTPGYRRIDLNFEEILSEAIDRQNDVDLDKLELEFTTPGNTPLNERGNDVSLDTEVGKMLKNSLRHRAYMLLLRKKYEQMDLAVKAP
jgi:flagellar basal-body rod protein FlgB